LHAFVCRGCGEVSPVREVKAEGHETYVICRDCSVEHLLRRVLLDSGVLD
jgi:hypothetical protein